MHHNFRLYLRDRVLRFTLYSKSIFEAISKVFIILFLLFKFFIKRLRKRPRNYLNLNILFSSRVTVNIYLIFYIAILLI